MQTVSFLEEYTANKRERGQQILNLPIESIRSNPDRARQLFDDSELWELSYSIKQHGVVQPVIVRHTDSGEYELIAGERRLRAGRLAGLKTIPAILCKLDYSSSLLMNMTENTQRTNLNFVEEARGYENLVNKCGMSVQTVARQLGKNPYELENKLRILTLPPIVIQKLLLHNLSEFHANALLRLKDPSLQEEVVDVVVSRGFDVAKTESYIDKVLNRSAGKLQFGACSLRNVKILTNTIEQISALLSSSGVPSCVNTTDLGANMLYTIVLPKPEGTATNA